ncbi:MAG: Mur ligase family protein [Oscillospiraceae bacterium]|nr:Mur ligase family protein [Oscillospiraceae bacterium]
MKIQVSLAILACRMTRFALRMLKRGGTALPGKVALKICPDLIAVLAKDAHIIAVTGTNGKTTSSRIMEQALADAGLNYFANRSGSNLIQGITADFADNATLGGKLKRDWAVIECDEAATKKVFALMQPEVILVTNVFRDQVDRFSDVTVTLESIRTGLLGAPNATVCLNADCSLTSSLADDIPNKVVFYGVDAELYKTRVAEQSDAPCCLRCGAAYQYGHKTYGHLGDWSCPDCGAKRPAPAFSVTQLLQSNADGSLVSLRVDAEDHECYVNLPGGYNVYNAIGAVAAVTTAGIPLDASLRACRDFRCGFGRMERFTLGNTPVRMILIKNTAGCNQVLNFLANLESPARFVICLNNNIADGTDISWIQDVDFEMLVGMGDMLESVTVAGTRAQDMAQRLQEAGIAEDKLCVCTDYGELLDAVAAAETPVFIMPTYTAMLELRERISHITDCGDFWE